MTVPAARYRFTVEDYDKMGQAGILGEDDRVELLEGEILEMAPIGTRHVASVNRLAEQLFRGLGGQAIVQVQSPIRLSAYSEPQPDLVLLRRRPDFYADTRPGPDDVLLAVEVADTSLPFDRDVKAPLYAQAGIPEFWLVDVNERNVTVYRDPRPDGYGSLFVAGRGDRLSPQAFPELVLTAGDIVG